jgi:hypothetical protein
MATEEPQTNLAQTIASNLEAVIEPAAGLAVVVAPGVLGAPVGLAEPAAQGVREALVALAVQVVPAAQEGLVAQAVQVAREAPAGLVVQEVVLALGIVLAEVRELETGPVAAELELRTVLVGEPELEVVQAEVPVPNQLRAHLAVLLRIRSVTEPRPHGLVPLLAGAEDLAVAEAETMHGQAAAEAVTAWAAAE